MDRSIFDGFLLGENHMNVVQFAFHDRVPVTPADILNGKSEKEFLAEKFQKGCILD